MKGLAWSLMLVLMLGACSAGVDQARMQALFEQYDKHCREHAREFTGEADETTRYEECMNYYIRTDVECPICTLDSHLTKAKP